MKKFLLILLVVSSSLLVFNRTVGAQNAPPPGGVNIDPLLPQARPTAEFLKQSGVKWVRMVYKANSGFDYLSLVKQYQAAGVSTVLVINQESMPKNLWPVGVSNFSND